VRNPLADVSATMFRLSEFGQTGPGRGRGMILKVNVQTAVLKYENLSNNQPYSGRADVSDLFFHELNFAPN
jgi:hypothetical protein